MQLKQAKTSFISVIGSPIWLFSLCLALVACGTDHNDPQAQIEVMLATAVEAAEDRSVSGVLDHVDENFTDNNGHDKANLKRMLQGYFMTNQQINIFTLIDQIEITGRDSANVVFNLATTGKPANEEDWTAFRADMQQINLSVVRNGDDWQVLHANWTNRYSL